MRSVSVINCIGYLGSELTSVLLSKGYHVKGFVSTIFNARDMDYIYEIEREYPGHIDIYEYDPMHKTPLIGMLDGEESVFSIGYPVIVGSSSESYCKDAALNTLRSIAMSGSVKSLYWAKPIFSDPKPALQSSSTLTPTAVPMEHLLQVLSREDITPQSYSRQHNPLNIVSVNHGLLLGPPRHSSSAMGSSCQGIHYMQHWLKCGNVDHTPLYMSDVRHVALALSRLLEEPIPARAQIQCSNTRAEGIISEPYASSGRNMLCSGEYNCCTNQRISAGLVKQLLTELRVLDSCCERHNTCDSNNRCVNSRGKLRDGNVGGSDDRSQDSANTAWTSDELDITTAVGLLGYPDMCSNSYASLRNTFVDTANFITRSP